jgi:ParB-like chromosome segregation protein Spo0J
LKIKAKEIEEVSIDLLIPHPKNCHSHSTEQIERLCKLIEYQGWRVPIICQKGTNLIVAGHGRHLAAKKIGMKTVPVSYQEFDSEAQLYAFIVSDNAIGKDTWATLNLDQIKIDIDSLEELDVDMLGLKELSFLAPVEDFEMDEMLKDDMNKKYILEITFPNEMELADIRDDLTHRGYIVKEK